MVDRDMLDRAIRSIKDPVLISGTGTIGTGMNEALKSAEIPTQFAKFSGTAPERFRSKPADYDGLCLIDGVDIEERVKTLIRNGIAPAYIVGNITENTLDRKEFPVVLDCATSKGSAYNIENKIYGDNIQIFQGGTVIKPEWLTDHLGFLAYVSAPGTTVFGKLIDARRIKQLSCNATITSTMFGLLNETIKKQGNEITEAKVKYERRFADPGEIAKAYDPKSNEFSDAPKYVKDVTSVLPFLDGKLTCTANKNPWREFHHSTADINFKDPYDLNAIRDAFLGYERCIFVDNPFVPENATPSDIKKAQEKFIRTASLSMGIDDGDIGLAIYSLKKISDRKLEIYMENPQQSITYLSTIDCLFATAFKDMLEGKTPFERTNMCIKHMGYSPIEIKRIMEKRLN